MKKKKSEILNPDPGHIMLSSIVQKVDEGAITIPKFQRSFVWSPVDVAALFDSILKGYPIGTFTLWTTKERLCPIKDIGGIEMPEPEKGETAEYVLDGQQRLTSIYACLKPVIIGKDDYSKIFVRLDDLEEDDQLVVTNIDGMQSRDYIPLREVFELDMSELVRRYKTSARLQLISDFNKRLQGYQLPVIRLKEVTLSVATEIFTRINTNGKSLSVFEIVSAKVYDPVRKFDLIEKRREQREKWADSNYGTISDAVSLEAVAICLKKSCKREAVLSLTAREFVDNWDKIDKAFGLAIECMQSDYGIPVSKILPYDVLLIPYVYYFFKSGKVRVNPKHERYLKDYFWRCALTSRFTEGLVSKLTQDVAIIDDILAGKVPKNLPPIDVSVEAIRRDGVWNFASAYAKAFLCILAARKPKKFDNAGEIKMDGKWLSHSNSVNYHHFFPKAYMRDKQPQFSEDEVNHIVNITIVDQYLNQKEIKARAPSDYMKKYSKGSRIKLIMRSHLIGDFTAFGITSNDYQKFFKQRATMFQKEIRSRIISGKDDRLK